MKKILAIILMCSSFFIFAEEVGEDFFSDDVDLENFDFDDMFGEEGDDSFLEVVEDTSDQVAETSSELLTTKGVEWGGSFSASISAGLTYTDLPGFSDLADPDENEETFSPDLSATLYFNARPTDSTRYYGKVSTSIPFYNSANALLEDSDNPGDVLEGNFAEVQIPAITIEELFTDFNYDNKLFFRVGKQNAKWGVGYFFSPADFLSLESIDPENPEADREGPIAIKMSMPFGLDNLYTFITVPNSVFEDSSDASISDLIVAPMYQILLGETEVSTGFYYQKDSAPRGMVSATYGTNSNFGQWSFFGEAVGLYGSDKTFIEDDYTTTTYDEKLFFNGTAGFMWSKDILENSFRFIGQYYYNGEGYDSDSTIVKDVTALYSLMAQEDLSAAVTLAPLLADGVGFSDLTNRHKHYLGLSFSISNLFDNEDLSISAFSLLNLVDVSGFIKPSITYSLFDDLSMSLGATFDVSDDGDEYDFGDEFAISLTVNLGGGSF
ncbi:MAG: hypothetical protein OCD02_02555 [Spirochaetaceae bacterium]